MTKLVWHVLSMVITMFHIDCSATGMSGRVYYHVLLSIQSALLNPPSCVCVLSMNSSNPKNITTCTYMDHERYSLHLNWSWLLITPLYYHNFLFSNWKRARTPCPGCPRCNSQYGILHFQINKNEYTQINFIHCTMENKILF